MTEKTHDELMGMLKDVLPQLSAGDRLCFIDFIMELASDMLGNYPEMRDQFNKVRWELIRKAA